MTEPVISIRNLSWEYPGGIRALSDISIDIYRNQFVAIAGQNGAGKSTLLQHMVGLLKPRTGSVTVLGRGTETMTVSAIASRVGFVLQNPDLQLFSSTVGEEVGFGPANAGADEAERERRVAGALEKVGLQGHMESFPLSLSRGDRARVVLASVLAMDPEIIILDEPTSGQDHAGAFRIMELAKRLREEGKTVIFVTHNMELVARYAQRVIVLKNGALFMDGTVREVFSRPAMLLETHLKPPSMTRLGARLHDILPGNSVYLNAEELGEAVARRYTGPADAGKEQEKTDE